MNGTRFPIYNALKCPWLKFFHQKAERREALKDVVVGKKKKKETRHTKPPNLGIKNTKYK